MSNVIGFPQEDPRDDPRYAGPIEPMQPGDDIDAATIVCADIVCGQITRTKLGFAASCVHRGSPNIERKINHCCPQQ
jgi:hypothetical protein